MANHQPPETDLLGDVPASAPKPERTAGQLTFDLAAPPSHAEADFIVAGGNKLAFEHISAFPAWPTPLTLLIGAEKAGKSHLSRIWLARSGALEANPENLGAIAGKGGSRPVLIEDIDRLAYDEVDLFHLLNQGVREARALLMTARLPVAQWNYKTADVLSRARLAAQFEVELGNDTQLSQMFVKLFADRQVSVDPKTIAYLVARMERSPAEVAALADLMDQLALARGSAVTRAIAASALAIRYKDDPQGGENVEICETENG